MEKDKAELKYLDYQIKVNPVPASTTQPLYAAILADNEARRREVKRLSLAITKQSERPFSFYQSDLEKQAQKLKDDGAPLPEQFQHRFIANPVPWRSMNTMLYKRMVEKDEKEREDRIRYNAELSYSMARLPPRMQEYEDKMREKQQIRSKSQEQLFSFEPARSKPVPDFQKLQRQFMTTLENKKQSRASTIPRPFNFNESKKQYGLREYMDTENKPWEKFVTRKELLQQKEIESLKKPNINPPSTKKMD